MKKYLFVLKTMLARRVREFKREVAEYERQSDPRTMDLSRLRDICGGYRQ